MWIPQEIVKGVFCYYPGFTVGSMISSLVYLSLALFFKLGMEILALFQRLVFIHHKNCLQDWQCVKAFFFFSPALMT